MKTIIKIQDKNLFLLNRDLLGLPEAQLWIGPNPDGPTDNNDERVLRERAEAETNKSKTGHRISGIEAINLSESVDFPGWFEVNTSDWQPGIYRFNIHSLPNIQAPNGTPLRPIRDGQYSWPNFSNDFLLNLPDEQKQFLYLEKNKAGFCLRIEKTEPGEIRPAGVLLRRGHHHGQRERGAAPVCRGHADSGDDDVDGLRFVPRNASVVAPLAGHARGRLRQLGRQRRIPTPQQPDGTDGQDQGRRRSAVGLRRAL